MSAAYYLENKMRHILNTLIVVSCLFLTGCSLLTGSGPHATIRMRSAHYLNPDLYGRASPVVVTIYQLKSPYAFRQSDYQALAQNSGKVLSEDLIDKTTIEVRPSEAKAVSLPISTEAQYLGVVAAYRNINHAVWHKVVKIEKRKGLHPVLKLDLQSQGFTATIGYANNFF